MDAAVEHLACALELARECFGPEHPEVRSRALRRLRWGKTWCCTAEFDACTRRNPGTAFRGLFRIAWTASRCLHTFNLVPRLRTLAFACPSGRTRCARVAGKRQPPELAAPPADGPPAVPVARSAPEVPESVTALRVTTH